MIEIDKIYCGDHLEIMKDIDDNTIDLTVTSPPYDDLRDYNGYDFDYKSLAKELYRVTKDGGVVVWVVGDATVDGSETGTSFKQALYFKEIGFNLHDTMIYEKAGFANPSHNRYHQIFEYMFIFSKGKPNVFNPIKDRKNNYRIRGGSSRRQKDGSMKNSNKGGMSLDKYGARFNIWKYIVGGGNIATDELVHSHPAAFPEQLASDHISSWSDVGYLILDPMCGSGTTCKVAMMNGRHFIGIDVSEEYCKLTEKRLAVVENDKRCVKTLFDF